MSGEFMSNPAMIGLSAGVGVLAFQLVWNKVTGAKDEESLPVQLAKINVQLAEIKTALKLAEQQAAFHRREAQELKEDFWEHMDTHHGTAHRKPPIHRLT